MKKLLLGTAVALATTGAAYAQGFESAQLGFQVYKYDEGSNINTIYAVALADASYMIAPRFGVQAGFAYSYEVDVSQPLLEAGDTSAVALHFFFDASDQTRIGLMLGADSYNDGDFVYAIEGTYVADRYRVEARIGRYDSAFEPATLAEISSSFEITGGLLGTGSYQRVTFDGGNGYFELAAIGLGYQINDRLTAYANYGAIVNDFGSGETYRGDQITLGVTMALCGPQNPRMFTYNPFY